MPFILPAYLNGTADLQIRYKIENQKIAFKVVPFNFAHLLKMQ